MINEIRKAKDKLIKRLYDDMDHMGIERMDTQETGQIVDMIKDLAEAEKHCMEAEYYYTVTEAMNEGAENPNMYGYDGMPYGYQSGNTAQGEGQTNSRMTSRMGYKNQYENFPANRSNRRGYQSRMIGNDRYGYSGGIQGLREEMRTMGKEELEMVKEELRHIIQEV